MDIPKELRIYSIKQPLMARIYSALETAKENATEVYNEHTVRYGGNPMTPRNKAVMEIMQKDIDDVESVINDIKLRYGANCYV